MNGKRIAAIVGLIAIFASVLCMVLGGAMPAYGQALLTLSGVCFLIAASVLGMLVLRRRQEQAAQEDSEEQQPRE